MSPHLVNASSLALGQLAVVAATLGLFRARHHVGGSPLHGALGALTALSLAMAPLAVGSSLAISPTTAVVVPAVATATLVTHLRDGTHRARELLLALLIAAIVAAGARALLVPGPELAGLLLHGGTRAALVFADALVVLVTYEVVGRLLPGLWVRVVAALALTTHADAVLHVTLLDFGSADWFARLVAGFAGASFGTVTFGAAASAYLYLLEDRAWSRMRRNQPLTDVLPILTLRQRFAPLRSDTLRDPDSGLYTRLFFEDTLPIEIDRADQYGRQTALVMLHVDGDDEDTLAADTGRAMLDALRMTDVPCRAGDRRYVAILPGADRRAAEASAERILTLLAERRRGRPPPEVTLAVGCYPEDGARTIDLVASVERRLEARRKRRVGPAAAAPG